MTVQYIGGAAPASVRKRTWAAVVATPATAITWGAPDGGDHPNVVALLFVRHGVGYFSCSGTLLTPYVVLTAGHCTEGGGEVNSVTYVRNDADIDAAIASEMPDYPGVTAWLDATWVAGQAVPHPEYNDYAEIPDTFDIGLILLEQRIYWRNTARCLPAVSSTTCARRAARSTSARHGSSAMACRAGSRQGQRFWRHLFRRFRRTCVLHRSGDRRRDQHRAGGRLVWHRTAVQWQ